MILLVRHAVAVARDRWDGSDHRRPLTARGERQALALPDRFGDLPVDRVLSSAALRCTATVGPLATSRGFVVKRTKSLAEGRGAAALDLVLDLVNDVVLCTHGDVVEEVLAGLRSLGWAVPARPQLAKGSTWVLRDHAAAYLPPPA